MESSNRSFFGVLGLFLVAAIVWTGVYLYEGYNLEPKYSVGQGFSLISESSIVPKDCFPIAVIQEVVSGFQKIEYKIWWLCKNNERGVRWDKDPKYIVNETDIERNLTSEEFYEVMEGFGYSIPKYKVYDSVVLKETFSNECSGRGQITTTGNEDKRLIYNIFLVCKDSEGKVYTLQHGFHEEDIERKLTDSEDKDLREYLKKKIK